MRPSPGGLVAALGPVLRDRGGVWVGWPGTTEPIPIDQVTGALEAQAGYSVRPVLLDGEEVAGYYFGFSNEILWPLFHDLQNFCNFDPAYWTAYQAANRKFAEAVAPDVKKRDYVWVHDYHLTLLARELRALGVGCRIGFFLHTPFPPLDIFIKLPWRRQILLALLDFDLVGFQTARDRSNFVHCVSALLSGYHHDARRHVGTIEGPDRRVKVGGFPISIDFDEFEQQASQAVVESRKDELRNAIPDRRIILGVDRLDYSKGIPQKLRAFGNALERFPELQGGVSLVQVLVPSREDILQYQSLKADVEGLVSSINGSYTRPGWIPIHYMFRNLDRYELLAYYRAADVALVTPLKDGMNLVAKEYCAANKDGDGVLILSEFAGAARQLGKSSIVVNPYDIEGVADAIHQAYHMDVAERRARMQRLRTTIRKRDIFWWVDVFLKEAAG